MDGYMNRLSLVLISSIALMFAACGDSGNGASPQSNADMDVRTYSELPSCAEKRDGKTAYVVDQEQGYICQNGEWVEDDDVKVVSHSEVKGSLTDSRDGQTYRTVTIGSQTWMAENLNYKTDNSYCYDDETSNCSKYGRLYTWAAAMDSAGKWSTNGKGCGYGLKCSPTGKVRGVCPSGWHLPTKAEIKTLFAAVGGQNVAAKKLKSTSGWKSGGNGTDDYSFSALPAGVRDYDGVYDGKGVGTSFWSSTENDNDHTYMFYPNPSYENSLGKEYVYCMSMGDEVDGADFYDDYFKNDSRSVRCIKDNASSSGKTSSSSAVIRSSSSIKVEVKTGSITDSRDGQTYKTVIIGTQTWMAQNLNYAYTGVPFNGNGFTSDSSSWCYENKSSNCSKYGRLYTWAVAMDSAGTWSANGKGCGYGKTCSPTYPVRGVCPTGWHLPTQTEWNTLFAAVGGVSIAGKKLKSTSGWNDYNGKNGNGTDDYSFSALPVGGRDRDDGHYFSEGSNLRFWSSSELDSDCALGIILAYAFDDALSDGFWLFKNSGYSVRCVKD